jgi:hypothetical protein
VPITYLLDAHTVLHRALPGAGADDDLDRRRRLLAAAARRRLGANGDRVHLVFDAAPGAVRAGTSGRDGPVSWEYARGSADDAIVAWLRREEPRRGDVVVVTDDRELSGRARQLGARVLAARGLFPARAPASPAAPPAAGPALPPMRPSDFGLPDTSVDLIDLDPDDLGGR